MAASVLNRVKDLTSGEGLDLVMVDGGALAGSGFGPGEMIECGIVRAGGGVRGSRMGMTGGAQ